MPSLPALMHRLFGFPPVEDSTPSSLLRRLDCLEYEDRTLFSATPMGAEMLVNTQTSGAQQIQAESTQAVAADSSGNFVVAWTSNGQDGDGNGVYAQRYDASGNKLGGEILANTNTTSDQQNAAVAVDANGDFVVVWESSSQDGDGFGIYGQRYDATGAAVGGEFLINSMTTNDQRYPSVAMDASGNFVVTWSSFDQDGDGYGIYGQLFDNTGATVGGEFHISTATVGDQTKSSVAFAGTGDFVVVWTGVDVDGTGVFGQRFNSSGVAQGSEFQINSTTTDAQSSASVSADSSGNFIVVWSSQLQDGSGSGIYAQRYNAAGATVGGEFRVNVTTAGDQSAPRVTMAADGGFVVSWTANGQDAANSDGVYFRQYDSSGTAISPETLVNRTTTGDQQFASLAMQNNDDFVVVWSGSGSGDAAGVFAQLYVDGVNQAPVNSVPGAQSTAEDATLVFSAANGNAVTIDDADAASNPVQVTLTGTNGNLTLASLTGLTFSVGDGTDDNAMTFTGTIADVNAALEGLAFTPTANFNGAAGVAITTNDLGYSGSGGAKSDSDNITVTVTAVNDAPTHTLPASQVTNINTAITLSTANGNTIVVADVDAGASNVRVTLTITDGTLTLGSLTGLSFQTGDGTSDATVTFTGTLAAVNNALEGLVYTPTASFVGSASLQITTNDLGNSGSGGAQSTSDSLQIEVVTEFRANTTINGNQTEAVVATDAAGNFVVVWTSDNQDGGGKGVYAQRFAADKTPIGTEFRVNTTTSNDQNAPGVAMAADGRFVIVWTSNNQDGDNKGVYAQLYDASGNAVGGEFRVNVTTAGAQDQPVVAMSSSGDFVVAWKGDRGGVGTDIYMRRYNASGVAQGTEVRANTNTTDNQDQPSIAIDGSGNFVVVWKSNKQDTSGAGVFGQRFNAAGTAVGSEFQVNTTNSGNQERPTVAMNSSGTFVVAWASGNDQDGDKKGVYVRCYDSSGVAQGNEFLVNTETNGDQDRPSTAIDDGGEFTVVWQSKDQDGNAFGVFAQRYYADGTTKGAEFRVNSTTNNDQKEASVDMSPAGDIVVVWQGKGIGDTSGIMGQTYPAVNDAPVNTVPGAQSMNEDATLVFSSGNGNQISIADSDALTSSVRVTLTATNGTVTLAGVTGLSFSVGDGTADSTMTFTGTVSAINTALNGLSFGATPNFSGAASLQIVTNDQGNSGSGGPLSDTDSVAITVNAVNDAPANTVPGPQSVNEDAALVFSSGNGNQISIADVDAASSSVRVTLTATNGTVTLAGLAGLSFTVGDGTADGTMTFTGTVSAINTALNGLAFNATANFNGAASLQIVTNDQGNTGSGGALSDTDSVAITVNAVNDAPVNTVPGPQSMSEDATLVFSSGNGNQISIADVDAGSSSVEVTLTATNGTVSLAGIAGLSFSIGDGTADANMTFTGTASAINTALNGLSFSSTPNFNGAASLQIVANDQGNAGSGGPLSDTDTVAITVNAVNDAPVNTFPGPQSMNEDATLVFSTGNGNAISIADLDAGASSVRVTLTATNGTISLAGITGLSFSSGDGTADAVMTFTGTITDVNTALEGLSFSSSPNFNGAASLQIVTNDQGNTGSGGALSDTDSIAITVVAVNDAPVNTVPGLQSMNEDSTLVFSSGNGNQISIADADAAAGLVQITLTATNGTLTLNGTTGLSFSAGDGTADNTMTFTGTVAAINTALNGLAFSSTPDFFGAASLQIVTDDQGNTGTGGALSDTDAVAITVNSVNDAPVLNLPASQSTTFRTELTFSSAQGNGISVADVDAGSAPLRLTIAASNGYVSLAQLTGITLISGTGTHDATVIVEGNAIDLNAAVEGMTFTPVSTYRGTATLSVTLDDLGNSGLGGQQTALGQINVDVQPASQRLEFSGPTQQAADNFHVVFSTANGNALQFYDVYEENPILTVTIEATNGSLALSTTQGLIFSSGSGSGASMSFTGSLNDVNAALAGAQFSTTVTDSSLMLTASDPSRDATGPQSAGTTIAITQPAVYPSTTPAPIIDLIVTETTNSDSDTVSHVVAIPPPIVAAETLAAVLGNAREAKPPPGIYADASVKPTDSWIIQPVKHEEIAATDRGFDQRMIQSVLRNASLTNEAGRTRGALQTANIPWSRAEITVERDPNTALTDSLIVGTAGLTASMSVGYVLWSMRAASLLSTMLSSMPAWQTFDPLPVIDFVGQRKNDDDDDDNAQNIFVNA